MRLFLRLNTDVNERLRALLRYQGELSKYIDQALTRTDLGTIELIPAQPGQGRPGLTAVISPWANSLLRTGALKRGCSITVLANSALHGWLEGKRSDP
jgi:hypothetical protein